MSSICRSRSSASFRGCRSGMAARGRKGLWLAAVLGFFTTIKLTLWPVTLFVLGGLAFASGTLTSPRDWRRFASFTGVALLTYAVVASVLAEDPAASWRAGVARAHRAQQAVWRTLRRRHVAGTFPALVRWIRGPAAILRAPGVHHAAGVRRRGALGALGPPHGPGRASQTGRAARLPSAVPLSGTCPSRRCLAKSGVERAREGQRAPPNGPHGRRGLLSRRWRCFS